jgi:hypothetical protein
LAAYRQEGVVALAHDNRGRTPAHIIPVEVRQQVLALATTQYAGANFQHLRDLLEQDGILLSRASVRRILLDAGVPSPRTCQRRAHRRERRAQEGVLVQIDGSPHARLEGRRPPLVLLVALDDATGKILATLLRGQEDAHGYLLLLRQLVAGLRAPRRWPPGLRIAAMQRPHGVPMRRVAACTDAAAGRVLFRSAPTRRFRRDRAHTDDRLSAERQPGHG